MDQRKLSRGLFGRRLRLEVLAWICSHEEPFFQSEIAASLGLPPSNVVEELTRLIALDMVQQFPRTEEDRRQYYVKIDSPFWLIIEAAIDALKASEAERG